MSALASQITRLTIVYSTFYSWRGSKKTSKLRVIGLCEGDSPGTGEFPTQRASNAENVSIWWRHHALSDGCNEICCCPIWLLWQYSHNRASSVVDGRALVGVSASATIMLMRCVSAPNPIRSHMKGGASSLKTKNCRIIIIPHYCDVIMGTIVSQITSPTIVYSAVYSGADQGKHQSSESCGEFTRTGEFPAQMASNAENVSIWWRHHEFNLTGCSGGCLDGNLRKVSWYQVYCHWWQRCLSLWQPVTSSLWHPSLPLVATKLVSWHR